MKEFDSQTYGSLAAELLASEPLCELGPGQPVLSIRSKLAALTPKDVVEPNALVDNEMGQCCVSGLWLLFDFLDESHTLSQDIGTTTGSYWHAIMHRREPDFSNSKYWFRRVGDHEIFDVLCENARTVAEGQNAGDTASFLMSQSSWDPYRFVDLCESARRDSEIEMLCRKIAQVEWRLLFDFCYRQAAGV